MGTSYGLRYSSYFAIIINCCYIRIMGYTVSADAFLPLHAVLTKKDKMVNKKVILCMYVHV